MNIFVGNLHPRINEEHLRQLFTPFGKVQSSKIITDFNSGLSKGFGFIEINDPSDAAEAIKKLNNTEYMESAIVVSEAKPRPGDKSIITAETNETSSHSRPAFRRR